MRTVSRFGLGLGLAIAAALTLLSPPAGAEERVVNFYNWSNYMAPDVLDAFTKETGIKVVYDTFDANETLETRLMAGKSGYDVVVPTAYFLQRQIKANIFQKLGVRDRVGLVMYAHRNAAAEPARAGAGPLRRLRMLFKEFF